MSDAPAIGYGAAFLAGLASFLSPCVLPLVPANIAIITGVSVETLKAGGRSALWPAISRTLLFIAGFSSVFTLMGVGFGTAGSLLRAYAREIEIIGGIVVIVFGLHLTGLVRIRALYRQIQSLSLARGRLGIVGTYIMGVAFGAAWQPCVGPILGAILALAAAEGQSARGAALLLAYSAGLGLPFLAAAVAFGAFLKASEKLKRSLQAVEVGSGFLLLILGLLLITNRFSLLARLAAGLSGSAG